MVNARALRLPVTLAALAVIGTIAGCANAPSSGPPRRATGTGSHVEAYVQALPPPAPTKTWLPTEVVLGFLHASASYAFDPAAAQQYLIPQLRRSWHPGRGPVSVVGNPNAVSGQPYNKPQVEGTSPGTPLETVTLTGQRLATLSQTGQYQYTASQNIEYQYQFTLAKSNGVWLIDGLPQGQPGLLLTQPDFKSVYQGRNLFFYTPELWQDPGYLLVPDPVYAPVESSDSALNSNLATGLVNGLIKGPGTWLSGATSSAFPAGTHLLKHVTIVGRVARVDIGGAAAHASPQQIQIMEAQLRATLEDRSYSEPLAGQVQLYIDNRLQVEWPAYSDLTVTPVSQGPVLAAPGNGSVVQLPSVPHPLSGRVPPVRVSAAQIDREPITAIAAEPGHSRSPQVAVAVQDQSGCAVFLPVGSPASYRSYVLSTSGGTCTSLSWDNGGNLWAAAGRGAWVLRPQNRQPVPVDMATLAASDKPGSQILNLRMAPDAVRAALLVHTGSGNKLLLAAARFGKDAVGFGQSISIGALPSGAQPLAISWLDAYHLAVLASNGVIYAMPLTGGAGIQPGPPPQALALAPEGAQTLTTDGSELVVGTSVNGLSRISASSPASLGWPPVMLGSDPVYPG